MLVLNDAPLMDEATKYSIQWNQRLWDALSDVNRIDLIDDKATRSLWEEALTKHNPDIIVHYGHGGEWQLVGDDGKALMDEYNCKKTSGRTVFTMCCSAAAKLGADAYRKGCVAWWGYIKPFSFMTTDEEVFCELANMGLVEWMVTGASWPKVLQRVKEAYDLKIDEIREAEGDPWTIIALVNEFQSLF